jgi:hypothetical protein
MPDLWNLLQMASLNNYSYLYKKVFTNRGWFMKKIISLGLLLLKIHFICYGSTPTAQKPTGISKSTSFKNIPSTESQVPKLPKPQEPKSNIQKLSEQFSLKPTSNEVNVTQEKQPMQITQTRKNSKDIYTENLTKAEFLNAANLVKKMRDSSILVSRKEREAQLLGKTMDAWFPDVNTTNKRIKNLETANRTTAKSILNQIKAAEFKHDTISLLNLTSRGTREQDYQRTIADNLVQSTLDNVFGKDSMSGQSLAKFTTQEQTKIMVEIFNNEAYKDLFDRRKSDIPRLNAIAKISDIIMNKICASEPGSSQPPIGKFETKINSDGSYETTITNDLGATTRTVVNNKGKTILRDYQDLETNTAFLTTVDTQGKSTTIYVDKDKNEHTLNSYEDSLVGIAYTQHKATIVAKSILKASLWIGKQGIITLFTNPIPTTLLVVAGVGLVPLVKGGSMIAYQVTGNEAYAWSSPTARSAIVHILEISCGGDRRGLISGEQGRVFKEGTMLSKAANAINPFGKNLSKTPEVKNQHEEYYTLMGEIVNIVKIPLKTLLPETLGDTLVSKAALNAEKTNSQNLRTQSRLKLPNDLLTSNIAD